MARVVGLGYLIVNATDLDSWKEFASNLLGLQVDSFTPERLVLRMDEASYRLEIRKDDSDSVNAIGWEVRGPEDLDELAAKLEEDGYAVKRSDSVAVAARRVSGLVEFDDPEGQRVELFYGLQQHRERFVSPTGARFVTGAGGLGHLFQMVSDREKYDALYLKLLGFKLSDYIEFVPGVYATFTHANQRHHSFAYAQVPNVPSNIMHAMFEVEELDVVGRAWDKVQAGGAPIKATFGKHTNDEMISFYVQSPSGFQVEYGYGGKLIDEDTWKPVRYSAASYWGHKRSDPDEPDL
ncbi:VOC family protein [Arthrobacter sp. efr-133-TYG-118]|uniref:VOC family protein n=1 Tax=Arthrobacter sp. efr-133-TYG-118 TaxID=3040279 RepID=UPI0025517156|nr:VOC family protein [Arthrobacter sp. efr-133-TYG-118]